MPVVVVVRRPVIEKLRAATEGLRETLVSDDVVLALTIEANNYVIASGKARGLLIILDELGKFLEYAALHPDQQDVFLLQGLAEAASRSGRTPLFVIGLLHQGFSAYADHLSQSAQREWEKVAGRFDELLFDQPLEQTTGLVGDALRTRVAGLPRAVVKSARADMQAILSLGWYGAPAVKENLLANAVRLYPLHPTVLPVLVRLFSRFGQNQRSLFSFLLSNEPFGLLEFAQTPVSYQRFYRLHHLYDYARATFGHRLSVQSYRSNWSHIESLIESFPRDDAVELQVLKTVGLLNLIDTNSLLATEDAIVAAVAGEVEGISANRVHRAIRRLGRESILYYRGASGGFCLWPHTSVNLERALEDAINALGISPPQRVSPLIESYLKTRPAVARRHYIETGNLRHFEVRFAPVEKLAESIRFSYEAADGRVVVALCETPEEHLEALRFAHSDALDGLPEVLLAIPSPLGVLGKLVQQLQRWEWVAAHTPELNNDSFARREVSRQIANARQPLEKRIQSLIGLQRFAGKTDLQWFRHGNKLDIKSNRELLEDPEKIGISLGTWIERLEEGTKIQQFVNAIESSLESAGGEFKKSVRSLSLEDYAYVQSFSLQQDGQPLGEYMLWLFNSYLGRLVFENNEEVNERRKVIDPISFDRLPLNQLMPSADLIEMYDSALFNKRIGDISKHPALIEAGVDVTSDAVEETCPPLPYLRTGLIFVNSESRTVLMVLNADCDLAHTPDQKRQPINFVTLIEGELGEIKDWTSPVREPKTDFFKLGEKAFHIVWKVNKVFFYEYAKVLHTLEEKGYQPYAHLRLPYALEVQRAYAAHFTRVGLPVSPPIWHDISVEILFRDDEGKPRTLIDPQSELAFLMTVRDPVGSEGKKQLQCRFTTQCGHSLKNAIARLTKIHRETLAGTGEADKNRRTQLDSKIRRLEESYAEFDSLFLGNPSPVLSGMSKPVPIFKGKNLVGIWRNMDKEQFDSWGNYYLLVNLIDPDDTEGVQHDE